MAIATFADLKAQTATFLKRADLTAMIPTFVQLAETRIYYGSQEAPFASEPLRIRAMEDSVYTNFNTQKIALPINFVQQRRLYLAGSPNSRVDYVTPTDFWNKWLSSTSGKPLQFTIEGEYIILGPTPDGNYSGQMLFYRKFDTLTADGDTNWLFANAPGVYLHATLLEAYRYSRNLDQAAASLNAFSGLVNGLNAANKADRWATAWTARSDTVTP